MPVSRLSERRVRDMMKRRVWDRIIRRICRYADGQFIKKIDYQGSIEMGFHVRHE